MNRETLDDWFVAEFDWNTRVVTGDPRPAPGALPYRLVDVVIGDQIFVRAADKEEALARMERQLRGLAA